MCRRARWLDVQLEERIRDLQHQNVRVVVLVTDQNALTRPAHAMLLVMLLEAPQSRNDRRIFFWLVLFRAEGVVAQRIQADRLRLIRVESFGYCWPPIIRSSSEWYGGGEVLTGTSSEERFVLR